MNNSQKPFFQLNMREMFWLVAIYGPLIAAYGIVWKVEIGGEQPMDRDVEVFGISIVFVVGALLMAPAYSLLCTCRRLLNYIRQGPNTKAQR